MRKVILLLLVALPLCAAAQTTEQPLDTLKQARYLKNILKYDEAIALLNNPSDKEGRELLAECQMLSGDTANASYTYYALAKEYPDVLFYRVRLMTCSYMTGLYEPCIEVAEGILKRDSIPAVLSMVGDAYVKLKQKDSAVVYYLKALHFKPYSESLVNKAGKILLDNKEYDKAIAIADTLLAVDPENEVVGSIKGVAHFLKKDYQTSWTIFEKQIQNGRNDFSGYFYLGMSALNIGDHLVAADNLKKAFACDSTRAEIAISIARELDYVHRDFDTEVRPWLDKALELLTPDQDLLFKAYSQFVDEYSQKHMWDEELKYVDKLLEIKPDDSLALLHKGYAYYRLKDYKNAIEYLERCIRCSKPKSSIMAQAYVYLKAAKADQFMEQTD